MNYCTLKHIETQIKIDFVIHLYNKAYTAG